MTKIFCCKDLGIECSWQGSATSQEELLAIVAEHARVVHKMKELNQVIREKIIVSMKDTK